MKLKHGEHVILLGPSGCGKTSLSEAISACNFVEKSVNTISGVQNYRSSRVLTLGEFNYNTATYEELKKLTKVADKLEHHWIFETNVYTREEILAIVGDDKSFKIIEIIR